MKSITRKHYATLKFNILIHFVLNNHIFIKNMVREINKTFGATYRNNSKHFLL